MDKNGIRKKFGDDYVADENTFIMGSDIRFTSHIAERFSGLNVLETCTGAGFMTISLAKTAKHVYTIETNESHQKQAKLNVAKAGFSTNVTFVNGNALNQSVLNGFPLIEAAFLDPDWAVTGPHHEYRFVNSNTQPPADTLLERILELTDNTAILLPPFIDVKEFKGLPNHERESLYIGNSHELFCLYFGKLKQYNDETEFRVYIVYALPNKRVDSTGKAVSVWGRITIRMYIRIILKIMSGFSS